jgi:DNA-binding MarR family transcriptional regulator
VKRTGCQTIAPGKPLEAGSVFASRRFRRYCAREIGFGRLAARALFLVAIFFQVTNALKYVNMADVNFKQGDTLPNSSRNAAKPALAAPLSADERPGVPYIELLFFAYRDFISDPDAVLVSYGFGRAHHRVVHFVNRHPGIRVADLLDILKITKQSLGRVLKQLVDTGFIEQRPGPVDRRQRLLYPTESGRALSLRLLAPQERRIGDALAELSPAERIGAERFLKLIIDEGERAKVGRLIGR